VLQNKATPKNSLGMKLDGCSLSRHYSHSYYANSWINF